MSEGPDKSHPRYKSLSARYLLEEAQKGGLLAGTAMIAHGRGEAFDHLIGEQTIPSALLATKYAAKLLSSAQRPIISINGNTAILSGDYLIRCAAILECSIEINIFYRTEKRISGLVNYLEERKEKISKEHSEIDGWEHKVLNVNILGKVAECKIVNLEGPRSKCCCDGIYAADVVFVPLEDGDRCEALIRMGKSVIVVDLNPLSRSAEMANVTIVDEISRVGENLFNILQAGFESIEGEWKNNENINQSLIWINNRLDNLSDDN